MNIKSLSEELASYIADAEKLERIVEQIRRIERKRKPVDGGVCIDLNDYEDLLAMSEE